MVRIVPTVTSSPGRISGQKLRLPKVGSQPEGRIGVEAELKLPESSRNLGKSDVRHLHNTSDTLRISMRRISDLLRLLPYVGTECLLFALSFGSFARSSE
ncbi:Protein of unknown function [Pyronema omphalodes CBS 100304]|uniref:Uncharacterized protein n=1 Tax=Pyronema omphalodes (strain CBS 100304) TaxID=1076935 RepID=U4LIF0_PYROM|nr:Protein of unknown function [Pyronema omphalodes CBS 100304]